MVRARWIIIVWLFTAPLLAGCLSFSASAGGAQSAEMKARQESQQETTTSERTKVEIKPTTIKSKDGQEIITPHVKIETGRTAEQSQKDIQSMETRIKQEIEAKSSANLNFIIILLIVLGVYILRERLPFIKTLLGKH